MKGVERKGERWKEKERKKDSDRVGEKQRGIERERKRKSDSTREIEREGRK